MGEVVNVLVAFAVIIFLLRWITSGKVFPKSLWAPLGRSIVNPVRLIDTLWLGKDPAEQRSARDILGFRPKNVTPDMVGFFMMFLLLFKEDSLLISDNRSTPYPQCFLIFQRNSHISNWHRGTS